MAKWTIEKPRGFMFFATTRTRLVKQCSGCRNGPRHCSYCTRGVGSRCTCSGSQCSCQFLVEYKVPGSGWLW